MFQTSISPSPTQGRAAVLLTCEHGGNQVPEDYAHWFVGHDALLNSHRGWDPGALATARHFADRLETPLIWSEVTRLLVDLNRSETNRAVFSEVLQQMDTASRTAILDRHYRPFRAQVVTAVTDLARRGQFVWHLSFHSFTPVLRGEIRQAEIGLLYDPSRAPERDFCRRWQAELRAAFPSYRIRLNYPYRGTTDGHTTLLRRQFSAQQYAGLEIEVNQALYQQPGLAVEALISKLADAFQAALNLGSYPPETHGGDQQSHLNG